MWPSMGTTPRRVVCDTGVQSAWQENTPPGAYGPACESRICSSCPRNILPALLHVGVTDHMSRRAGTASPVSLRDAVNTHEACFAVERSAREGRPVRLPLDE